MLSRSQKGWSAVAATLLFLIGILFVLRLSSDVRLINWATLGFDARKPAYRALVYSAAWGGNATAARLVAEHTSDASSADRWWQRALRKGDPQAVTRYTLWRWHGVHTSLQAQEALPDMQNLARSGNAEAAYLLAAAFWNGELVPRDQKQAMALAQQAALRDHTGAMNLLAEGLMTGSGISANRKDALTWLQRAAQLEDPVALETLAMAYDRGDFGLTRSSEEGGRYRSLLAHALTHHHEVGE